MLIQISSDPAPLVAKEGNTEVKANFVEAFVFLFETKRKSLSVALILDKVVKLVISAMVSLYYLC